MPCLRDEKLTSTLAVLLLLCSDIAVAAEVRGSVSVDYQGLFQHGSAAQRSPVSVALQPAAGQRTPKNAPSNAIIEIVANRMRPSFLTVPRGTTVEFLNRDDVYHELFSLSAGTPVKTRLAKAGEGDGDRASFTFDRAGTVHFFCRIHNKGYARIDVVDTSLIQTLQADGAFSFQGLQAGPWRLRVAAPASETQWVDVDAVTSPPPLHITIKSRVGSAERHSTAAGDAAVSRLYRTTGVKGEMQ